MRARDSVTEGDNAMRSVRLKMPELALIAGTRGMMGAGAGLLLSRRLSEKKRKAVGWTLFLAGALSTIPLAGRVFRKRRMLA
jgi:hypothetical protein